MQTKKNQSTFGKKFWCACIVIGLLFLGVVYAFSRQSDIRRCEEELVTTVEFIKERSSSYVKYNDTAIAKSLVRETTAVHALSECTLDCDDAALEQHAEGLWLTGVSMLDAKGNLVSEYTKDGIGFAQIQDGLDLDTILSVIGYPQKTYVKRVYLEDGSFADTAAHCCANGTGVMLAYRHTKAEFVQKSVLSVQSLLNGYDADTMGTILLVEGNRVEASNVPELIGTDISENEVVQAIRESNHAETLKRINDGNWLNRHYGMYGHGRDYYLYAYVPAHQVYNVTAPNMASALIVYLLVLALVLGLRWSSVKNFRLQQAEIEQEYKNSLEQKNAELELAVQHETAANRAKREFLFNMSHDIRTPMNAIIGFTSLAAAHIDNREQVIDYLKKISTASQHLLSLINDVLDMSRIESGKVALETKPVHLPDLVHDIRDIIQSNITSKRLSLYIDTLDVSDEDVIADPMRLNQVLLNILTNAIKFTPTGGMISLRILQKNTAPKGYADYEFHVRDNGIGMSEEFRAHIFEQFSREKTSTVSKIQGTGLGMSITKNLVDMMGGTITVDSEPGQGSEFTVSLRFPLCGEKVEQKQIPQLEGLRALVADDDTDTCLNVSKMLRSIGMRPDWTISGKEAVIRTKDALEQGDAFSVYIIDWLIPDMNGLEVVRQVRKIIGEATPIIILTAYDWSDIEDEAKAAGVTAFCAKPLFMSELRNVLAKPFSAGNSAETVSAAPHFAGKKLLVVEDNELNLEIASTVLRESGFVVDTAENGKVALEKVKHSPAGEYDVILMDIQMPVMDGYEATRRIRALSDPKKAGIPIIAMTANAFEEDRQNAIRAGMNGHLSKPFDVQKLICALTELLGRES